MPENDGDDGQHLAVSTLRSRFERLASEGSVPQSPRACTPTEEVKKLEISRARTGSFNEGPSDAGHSSLHLRTSSSSSDLKVPRRPPPPPPPSRSPKPVLSSTEAFTLSPNSSTLSLPKQALIQRRPPPPPSIVTEDSDNASPIPPGGVASLRSKFA